jgi:hypothetical protein
LGESKENPTSGYELDEEPLDAGFFAVLERRDAAGFDAERFEAGLAAVERLVEDDARFAAVERLVEDDARFAAVERLVEDDARFAAFVGFAAFAGFAAFDAAARRFDAALFAAGRRAAGFFAAVRVAAAVEDEAARGLSRAETRLARPSRSRRRPLSSWSTRSSSTSRIRLAAPARSPASSCAGPRSDWAPSAVAAKVRSTAERTASTASTAPAEAWSCLPFFFFFESFFAMTARS